MALEALDADLAGSFWSVEVPGFEPASPIESPIGSFRSEVEDRRGEALAKEYEDALGEADRLMSNVMRIEEEYFEFPTSVRLAGQNERIESLKSQWESLTDKMDSQRRVIRDIEERRRMTGRDLILHRLQEAMEAEEG